MIAAPDVIDSPDTEIGADEFEALNAAADAAATHVEPVAQPATAAVPESGLGAVRFSVLDESVRAEPGQRHEVAAPQNEDTGFAQDLDAQDAIDPELFEIFSEEAQELLPTLASHLRAWEESPDTNTEAFGALRALHTLKGSARLAGAMRLGELAHRLESAFEERVGGRSVNPPTMATLHTGVDALDEEFQRLQRAPRAPEPVAEPMYKAPAAAPVVEEPQAVAEPAPVVEQAKPVVEAVAEPVAPVAPVAVPPESTIRQIVPKALSDAAPQVIDWARFSATNPSRIPARHRDGHRQSGHRHGARQGAAAGPPGQPGRRSLDHAFASRERRHADARVAARTDGKPGSPASPVARHRAPGRHADRVAP